jgi:hypothetical protein
MIFYFILLYIILFDDYIIRTVHTIPYRYRMNDVQTQIIFIYILIDFTLYRVPCCMSCTTVLYCTVL